MDAMFNWDEFLTPYSQAVDELVVKLSSISDEHKRRGVHSPIIHVEGRVKQIGSILEKANRKNISHDEIGERIDDIAGVRIICRFVEDIDKVIELIRKRDGFDLKIIEERDYIKHSKPSGYQSYHIILKYRVMTADTPKDVWAEMQIRTLAMNFWATIEHSLKYKYHGNIPEDVRARLKNSATAAAMLDREMSLIRHEITEAQREITDKNELTDDIVKTIQSLYYVAKLEKVNELNREFIDIYQGSDLEKLTEFNAKLKAIAKFHKLEYM